VISLSWDAFITLFFIVATVYGFVLQKDKLTVVLISSYVALAVANVWSENVFKWLQDRGGTLGSWATNTSLFTVAAGLFIVFVIVVSARGGISADEEKSGVYGPFIMAVLGFLTAGLILSSVISFMPDVSKDNLIASSRMAAFVWKYHIGFIVLPPILLAASSMFKKV